MPRVSDAMPPFAPAPKTNTGWNSWNAYGPNINEDLIKQMVKLQPREARLG